MPILLIFVLILGVVWLLALLAWASTRKSEAPIPSGVPIAAFALAFIVFLFTIFTIVPTRSIGVVTTFGKPSATLSNGIHLKAPWQKVRTLDGTIQTNARTGSDARPTGTDGASCTDVRIGNGSTACVDNSVRWRIKLDAGQRLYQDYPKGMQSITDSLVKRQMTSALNDVLGQYNPLDQIKDQTGDATVTPNLSDFSDQVEQALIKRVGNDIEIEDVILPIIRFDSNTQAKINAYQAEVANTRIAEQSEQTAKAQARANENLKQSVDNNPNVLVARCLDSFAEMVKDKQDIPIGFSCWPGGSASSVVIPKP